MQPLSHSWDLSPPSEAIALQKRLASQVLLEDTFQAIETIAGADLALSADKESGYAAFLVYEFPALRKIETVFAEEKLRFPYVPGLLSFREGPVLLKAFEKLRNKPDLILFDGQGIAHPRRLGIASHMGLILNIPSIGCAKSVLCGRYQEPGPNRGDSSDLIDRGEVIGKAVRTKPNVKPMFISPGHRVSLEKAVEIVLQCHGGYRLPLPTHEADRFVGSLKFQQKPFTLF